MSYIVYNNLLALSLNFVDDTILAYTEAIQPFCTRELYCLLRKWVSSEFFNAIQYSQNHFLRNAP